MGQLVELLEQLWDPLKLSVGAALGAIITHLWSHFRRRVIPIRYTASVQSVALSGTDATFGNVEVTHNGREVQNLYLAAVEVANDSTRDLVDFEVQIGFRDGTEFLAGIGTVQGSLRSLPWAPDFASALSKYLALPPEDKQEQNRIELAWNRIFQVPLLNRGDRATFAFLVDAPHNVYPTLHVSSQHQGVRLRARAARPHVLGVRQDTAGWVGLVVVASGMALLASSLEANLGLVVLGVLLGSVGQAFGAAAVRLWRLIIRVMS